MRRVTGLLLALGLGAPAWAQASPPTQKSEDAKLAQPVTLQVKQVPLKSALQQISAQIGVQVVAADYLEDRLLTAQLEGVSASAALDALCDMYHWHWFRLDRGVYQVARPNVGKPADLPALAAALRDTLPIDARRVLKLDQPETEVRADTFRTPSEMPSPWHRGGPGRQLDDHVDRDVRTLVERLNPALYAEGSASYAKLAPEDARSLVRILYFKTVRDVRVDLMRGTFPSYVSGEGEACLVVQLNTLWFGARLPNIVGKTFEGTGAAWPYGGGARTLPSGAR